MQRHSSYYGGEKALKDFILASWISWSITLLAIMSFSLYFNYRLNKMIKMLDESITERPE